MVATLEEWLPVRGFEGYYEVSNLGRVKSVERYVKGRTGTPKIVRERIMSVHLTKHGYARVELNKENKAKKYTVHSLVANTFIAKPDGDNLIVRHGVNGVSDNSVDNLSWGTHSDNEYDKQRDGTNPLVNRTRCPRNHPLISINLRPNKKGRECLACSRARAYLQKHDEDMQIVSDRYYAKITFQAGE